MDSRFALIAILLLSRGAAETRPATERPVLRIVTWNIHGCAGGIDAIIEELRKIDADVVCLQEAEAGTVNAKGADQAALIAARLGMKQYSAGSRFAAGGGEQRMAILSRRELEQTGSLDADTGRIYGVTAVIHWNGKSLRLVSVHLTSTYRVEIRHATETTRARPKEATDLAKRLDDWKGDVIVAGDFNSVPGLPELNTISAHLMRVPATQPTYPADHPQLSIDHLYHSPGLAVQQWAVRDSAASDHRPLVVGLTAGREIILVPPATRPSASAPALPLNPEP